MNISLALVHLGETNPSHLWANIRRIQKDFPNLKIVLIGTSDRILKKAESLGITTFTYKETRDEENFFSGYPGIRDYEFRNGFWKYSLQRLFALSQFHQYHGDHPLIHIENDIYITSDFPFEKFSKFTKMAWSRYNSVYDVAAILFSPSVQTSISLAVWIKEVGHSLPELSDMNVLNLIARTHESVALLPIADSPNSLLLNQNILKDNDAVEITKHFEFFEGYFDPAGIGMWSCGIDPRNNLGFTKRLTRISDSYVQPWKIALSLNDGRITDDKYNSIYNLHIHSKSLKILGVSNPNYLKKLINSRVKVRFSPKAFKAIVIDYAQRGKILHLIYNIPPFTQLRKIPLFIKLKDFALTHFK